MLKVKSINNTAFYSNKVAKKQDNNEYRDPLLEWPLRGAAFTNEIGEAMRPLIGEYATLSWLPALLYFGADIYDKYKCDKAEYKPDNSRGIKEAVFQGMASIIMPLAAVKAGQGIFSYFGLLSKDKTTITAKEQVSNLATEFIANGRMRKYKNDDKACVEDFVGVVKDNIGYKKGKNPIKRFLKKAEEFVFPNMKLNNEKRVYDYAENTIKDLVTTRKHLLAPNEEFKKSSWYQGFVKAKESGQTSNVAVKTTLTHYQNNKLLKDKSIKTLGGFIALFALIKPIDTFVENVLIEKVVTPILDKKRNLR